MVYCRIDKGVWLEKNKAGYRVESREQTYLTWKMGSRVWTEQARAIWGKAVKTRAKDFKCFVVFQQQDILNNEHCRKILRIF